MQPDEKVNILLVDDQPGNLLALEAILADLGQNLVKARSGREALRYLLRQEFAVILLDVQMPEMDGLETAALIRERDKTRHVPIIFLTAYERTEVQVFRGYSLGAVDYLTKPLVPEVLRSKVAVFVELFQKTEQVRQQADLLRESQQRAHERRLAEEKQRWEMDRLRAEAARERQAAEELARTVAERVRAEEQVRERARQQALVAELGQQALAGIDIPTLLDQAVVLVARTLEVEHCLLLELLPTGNRLRLRAGVGWPQKAEGRRQKAEGSSGLLPSAYCLLPSDLDAGPELLAEEPVIAADLGADPRFRGLGLPEDVVSGVSVVVRGAGRPFGVLGAFTGRRRDFCQDDAHFLEAVANVLAAAIQRRSQEEELATLKDRLAAQLDDMTRLQQLSARLSETLELPAVLEEVLGATTELQGTDRGLLLLCDREHGDLYQAASRGLPREFLDRLGRVAPGAGVGGVALCRRVPVVIEDFEEKEEGGRRKEESEQTASGSSFILPPSSFDLVSERGLARVGKYRAACGTPLLSRGGDAIGVLVTFFPGPHRPSERDARLVELYTRQAAQAIDNARLYREMEEANRGKDEFLAMLAHELRNPLAPILNALHVMRLSGGAGKASQQALDMVERQTRHMTRLIDDLLDVSRITRGKIQLRPEPVDLAWVVGRAVDSTRPLIEARNHRLEVALGPEPVQLLADATRLEQVLANLLNNAAKYTEPGGYIALTAGRENGQAVIRVRDTGIGIPPAMLPRVFELFMQAHVTPDRSLGGLGIGLTLVRRLVEMHGGSVEVHSEGTGKGSEFVVRLPALDRRLGPRDGGEQPSPIGTATPAPSRRGSLRVLVVDDNRDAAESLSMMLRLDGHEVRMAHDGRAALEVAGLFRPEVVLLDIGLPGSNGYDVARQLQDQFSRPLLLVAMTGYGSEEDRRRSEEAGFDYHLVKPVDPHVLRELLAQT